MNANEDENMQRELYIFGESVETGLGEVRFLTYKEYLLNMQELSLMSMNVLHIYHQYRKMIDEKDAESMSAVESLKEESLYSIVMQTDSFRDAYVRIFSLVLESNDTNDTWSRELLDSHEEENKSPLVKALETIFTNEELFMHYRELVMDMNMMSEAEVNANPEIQKGIELSQKAKSDGAESPTPTDIISSVVAGTSTSFEDACVMTVLQIYSIFYRLGAFKNYDTTTLFATVSGDVKIEPWSKKIDLYERDTSRIKKQDFDRKYGGLMN